MGSGSGMEGSLGGTSGAGGCTTGAGAGGRGSAVGSGRGPEGSLGRTSVSAAPRPPREAEAEAAGWDPAEARRDRSAAHRGPGAVVTARPTQGREAPGPEVAVGARRTPVRAARSRYQTS